MNRGWAKLLLALLACTILGCGEKHHASDDRLLTLFKQQRAGFEELRQMIAVDKGLVRVAEDFTDPSDPATIGISAERVKEYRKLLAKVDCPRGLLAAPARPGIYFLNSTRGLSIGGGSAKGFCYIEDPQKLNGKPVFVSDTGGYRAEHSNDHFSAFRRIEGNWYLWLEYD